MRACTVTALLAMLVAFNTSLRVHAAVHSRIRWRDNIEIAALEAKGADKPLLIEFSTTWCRYCKKMQRETFSNEKVISHVKQCFVPVSIDGDTHRRLAEQMGVRSYPTTVIISPELKVVAKITGFRTADQLTVDLTKICTHSKPHSQHGPQLAQHGMRESVFGHLCPVTPIINGKLLEGDPAVSTIHRGFRLMFQSESYRDEFQQHPERYWPVADGQCIVSALDEGVARLGTLQYGLTYRGGIWLFASQAHLERFYRTPDVYFDKLEKLTPPHAVATRQLEASSMVRARVSDIRHLPGDSR